MDRRRASVFVPVVAAAPAAQFYPALTMPGRSAPIPEKPIE